MTARINRQWLLVSRPEGHLQPSNFQWAETAVPELRDGQVLIRTLQLSLDPTNRGWANATATYLPPIPLGEVMRGIGLGIVEESRHPGFRVGQLVQGLTGWQSYLVSDGRGLGPFDPTPGLPLEAYLGLFGHIGATAYFGLLDVGRAKAGETLVVSGAAGAVGSLVGQIGKILGCRVVGIAGGPSKCKWLVEDLGFDAAIDYKREPVQPRLRVLCKGGIDVAFENVGGSILDAVLANLNLGARVVLCGMISAVQRGRASTGAALPGQPAGPARADGGVHRHRLRVALPGGVRETGRVAGGGPAEVPRGHRRRPRAGAGGVGQALRGHEHGQADCARVVTGPGGMLHQAEQPSRPRWDSSRAGRARRCP